mgnify:FL=1
MKNTTKISLMSGLMFVEMALGGIHIANAQNNVNPEIDNSRYTVMIPSEVNIDKNTGKGSFAVTGKVKAQSTIDVSIQSKNGYKLKDKNGELPYNIDKKSFSIDNSRSASDIPLNEEFNIASKTNTKVSGYYTDSLTFDVTSESYKYRLDVNGNLDDNGIGDGRLDDFGRFDVYLNGKLVKENVEDFCEPIPYGTTWEIKNIRSLDGYRYKDSSDIRTKGVAGDVVEWEGDLLGDTSIYRITYVNLKFYSNKLTINYHADGDQSWKTANVNNASEIDVTGKDIMETEALKYDELYSEDAEKQHFCSIARIKRDGYTAKANTWKVGQNGSLEVQDNKILQKAQDVAKYCGVLNEFKKNDTTIDLYPIWSPIQSQLNLNANGGSFSDNSSFKTATDKLVYDSSSNVNISSYTPTRKGYDFDGWYTDEAGGTKVYNADGSAVNGTQYWQNNVYQNIEGTNILRGDAGQNMAECLFYGNSYKVFDGKITDNDWVNDSSLKYGKCKKITISPAQVENNSYRGSYSGVLYNYSYRSSYPIAALCGKKVQLSFKIKSDSPMTFDCWGLENTTAHSPYELKTDPKWKAITVYTTLTDAILSGPCSLVFYTSSSAGTYYVGDVSITLDTDIELFAHWTKKNYSTGAVLNIEGSDYIVMSRTDDDKYLVIRKDSIGDRAFQSSTRIDGQNRNTYEDSEIDNYLENDWYNSLSTSMKVAIDPTDIKQSSYSNFNDFNSKQETGYNGQIYNIIKRHVFLPSVNEIENVVDLNKSFSIYGFVGHNKNIWTRDSIQNSNEKIEAFYGNYRVSGATTYKSNAKAGVRPTFVIDLSKVDYTVTGHVSYK